VETIELLLYFDDFTIECVTSIQHETSFRTNQTYPLLQEGKIEWNQSEAVISSISFSGNDRMEVQEHPFLELTADVDSLVFVLTKVAVKSVYVRLFVR